MSTNWESETGQRARGTKVRSVMRLAPVCPAEFPRDRLVQLLGERGEAVVLDGDGKPVGVITRCDLSHPGATAGELFHPLALTLDQNVPLSVAVAVMAHQGVDRVAVVGDERRYAGLLTSRDVLAWLAREAGHG